MQQAQAIARALGVRNPAIAEYPGVIMMDNQETFNKKVETLLVEQIVNGLSVQLEAAARRTEPAPEEAVFRGTLDEVQEYFRDNSWTDGLPIIPPTLERVEEFLKFSDRSDREALGTLPPDNGEATIWNIAVNGVMAGCRPEYMPILVAVVEAISDPEFRLQDAGSTPGWEPLVILNGPLIKQLDFNYGTGVMRIGRQANSSIGRFLRLYMRNVAGLRIPPGATDKGTIAFNFNVVLPENEDVVSEIGWAPFSVERGFKPDENVATVQSVVSTTPPIYTGGANANDHVEVLGEILGQSCGYWTQIAVRFAKFFPLLVLGPSVARVLAEGGWTKAKIKKYLYENVTIRASLLEKYARMSSNAKIDFVKLAEEEVISRDYVRSSDPDRPVPVFLRPDWIGIVVAGDPGRNQSKGYVQNHEQGPPVSRSVVLPTRWDRLLKETRHNARSQGRV